MTTSGPTPPQTRTTTAFYVQAVISFGVALAAVAIAVAYLPTTGWVRGFLGLGGLYLVTSTFTLAKCVRDQQESGAVLSRLDQARLERLLAEFDPYQPPSLVPMPSRAVAQAAPPPVGQAGGVSVPASMPPAVHRV